MSTINIQTLLNNYQSGFSLEQAFYTDNNVFDFEWQYIFKKSWLYAGNTAQIPKPGDYFLYHLRDEAIIIIRGNKGEIYALYNTCRHRGSAICLQDKGNAAKLICPYHQWVNLIFVLLFKVRFVLKARYCQKLNMKNIRSFNW